MPDRLLRPDQLDDAVALLREGALVSFPTDTVYGVAALAWDADAVARLYEAKARPFSKAIPVMVAEPEAVPAMAHPTAAFWRLAAAFWPGPLTMILPKTDLLPAVVTAGGDTVALRIPDHPLALALLRQVAAPLAVTSANLSGHPPARTAAEALAQLGDRIAAVLDGGLAPGGQPSTILDLTQSPPRILRAGPIPLDAIRRVLLTEHWMPDPYPPAERLLTAENAEDAESTEH